MKKSKLLSLVALASLGLNANAQDLQAGKYYIQNVECGKYIASGAAWGTRSVLFDEGVEFNVTLENGVYTLGTRIVAEGKALRPTDGFMDQSGTWEVIPNGNGTFKVKGSNGYLKYDGSSLPSVSGGSTDAGTDWRFLSKEDREALLDGASETNPKDATFYITAPDFLWEDLRIKTDKCWGSVVTGTNGLHASGTTEVNNTNGEMYNKAVGNKLVQTLTGVRNGKYKVSCLAFYRAGTAVAAYGNYDAESQKDAYQYAQLFANNEKTPIKSVFVGAKATAGNGYAYNSNGQIPVFVPNGQGDAAICFMDNTYLNELEVIVSDNQLTLGIEKTGHVDSDWCLFDSFRLTYLGAVTDLSAFKPGYDKAVADATGVDQNAPMNASVLSDLKTAISTYNVDFSTFSSADDISAAVTALNGATKNANESIEAYAAIAAKLNTLDQSGKAAFLATEVGQKYTNKTYSTEDYSAELIAAVKAQTTVGADLTLGYITNPGAESGVADPWEVSGRVINGSSDAHTGSSLFETAGWGPHFGKMTLKVTLPKGKYDFKAFGMASAGTTEYLVVYDEDESEKLAESASVVGVGASAENRWFQLTTTVNIPKEQTVVLAAESSTEGGQEWANFDDFSLIYQGEADEEPEAINVTAITLENSSASLNSTNNTATFVATVLPSDATNKKIKWTSSDENVAKVDKDGVVTGVAPGTATITATSADNEEIKATATVTTSYSETTPLPTTKTVEHVDGSKTVYTFSGVNIIKNGSFEYGDPFFGWTNGKGSALAADKFTAADGTITSKASEGNGGAGSVATKWSVDANTTYVFGYRTKANVEGNAQYQKVSLTNDGTESQVVSDNEQIVGTNWTDVQYIFTNAEYSGLQFRARWLDNNVVFDDFYLMKVTDIEEIAAPAPVIADLTVNDGVAVEASQDAKNITYVREFKAANKWQSLYLPFSVNLENNDADVVLAKIDDVIEDNGELVIKIIKVSKYETVVARRPLFIAAKTVGVKNIKTGVSTIDEPLDGGYDYSAAEFIGVLSKASAGQAGRYVMSGGELCLVPQSMNNLTLGVNRWAMYVNDGSSVRIRINAEGFSADEATAIASAVAESVENGEIFSINGAKVKDAKSGLYIKGGKKVYVK